MISTSIEVIQSIAEQIAVAPSDSMCTYIIHWMINIIINYYTAIV
jgi:hypothetical protein